MQRNKSGMLVHYCYCGQWGAFGFGVRLREGKDGIWLCAEHKSEGERKRVEVMKKHDDKHEDDLFGYLDDEKPDPKGSKEARDAGMKKVDERDLDWRARARTKIRQLPSGWSGSTEDMRMRFAREGFERPPHYNAWGPLTAWAVKAGYLVWTGKTDHAKIKKDHSRRVLIYRRP